jgi:hypothetical protein
VSTYWPARPSLPALHTLDADELAAILDRIEYAQAVGGNSRAVSNAFSGTQTSAVNNSYVDMPAGGSMSNFVKRFSDTRLAVFMAVSSYATTAGLGAKFGVRINGVDYDVARRTHNALSDHQFCMGTVDIPAIAAGTYTVQGRMTRTSGTGTLNIDTGDDFSLRVTEIEALTT